MVTVNELKLEVAILMDVNHEFAHCDFNQSEIY